MLFAMAMLVFFTTAAWALIIPANVPKKLSGGMACARTSPSATVTCSSLLPDEMLCEPNGSEIKEIRDRVAPPSPNVVTWEVRTRGIIFQQMGMRRELNPGNPR